MKGKDVNLDVKLPGSNDVEFNYRNTADQTPWGKSLISTSLKEQVNILGKEIKIYKHIYIPLIKQLAM